MASTDFLNTLATSSTASATNSAASTASKLSSKTSTILAGLGLGLDALNLASSLYAGITNAKAQKEANEIAKASLEETKEQNAYERQKYETALANQQEGISALGSVFSSALEKSQSSDSTSTDASSADSSLTGSTDASASVDGSASTADATTSKAASEGTSDASVPTQRD